jgi:NADH-quinone oxidoreductase subunit E
MPSPPLVVSTSSPVNWIDNPLREFVFMSSQFSPELRKVIEGYLSRFETKRSSILPILHAIQDDHDWVSNADVEALEKEYDLLAVDVREVLTFYSMYRTEPPKPYRFEVCNSISCWLCGSEDTVKAIEQKLEAAERSGKPLPFEVHKVECLGVCGYAPAALINKDRHLNVTPDLALKLVEEYQQKELPAAAKNCAKMLTQLRP